MKWDFFVSHVGLELLLFITGEVFRNFWTVSFELQVRASIALL